MYDGKRNSIDERKDFAKGIDYKKLGKIIIGRFWEI